MNFSLFFLLLVHVVSMQCISDYLNSWEVNFTILCCACVVTNISVRQLHLADL